MRYGDGQTVREEANKISYVHRTSRVAGSKGWFVNDLYLLSAGLSSIPALSQALQTIRTLG
jgi:hypothetical protein